jgi:phosphoribosylanthranilate isomerase
MSATIKICGLRDKDAINTAINFGAKYLGFVCNYPKSPRNVSPYQLVEIMNNLPDNTTYKVAVLVDPDDGLIDIIKNSINFLQLHGSETNERILDIKRKFNINIIKAIKIKTEEDLKQIDTYTNADDLLLDTPAMEKSEFLFSSRRNKY